MKPGVIRPPACEGCPYKNFPRVGSKGPEDSPIVIVGESPGWEEVKNGVPFFGDSGQVLNACIPKGAPEPYITNAFQCFPGGSDQKSASKVDRACKACNSRLLEEIKRHPRELILSLGGPAIWSLTGDYNIKITQVRGSRYDSPLARRGILATYHPAFMLRGGGSFRKFKSDIEYAFHLAQGGSEKKPIANKYEVIDTHNGLEWLYSQTLEHEFAAADLETTGLDQRKDKILCAGLAFDPSITYVIPGELFYLPAFQTPLKKLFESQTIRWIWHNGKFDIAFMRRPRFKSLPGIKARVDEDTMLISYALDSNRGIHGLANLQQDLLGATDHKSIIDAYRDETGAFSKAPKHVLYTYLGLDVSDTLQCFNILRPKLLADADRHKCYSRIMIPASAMLEQVEWNGFYVDMERVRLLNGEDPENYDKSLVHDIEINKAKVNEFATEHLGHEINPNSPQQVARLVYDGLKLPPVRGKGRSTDKDVLEKLKGHPLIDALKKYRTSAKMRNTYITGKKQGVLTCRQDDGRVHSTYLIHGTVTGRLSSQGPNMQNIPRDKRLRGMFIAAPGKKLLEIDLNQAELRCLAALSGDPELCRIYIDAEESLHYAVSYDLWGKDWKQRYEHPDKEGPIHKKAYDEYMRTKALNFGIVYGREAYSIASEFKIEPIEAQGYIDVWAHKFPVAWQFIQACRKAPLKGITLKTVFGRKRSYGLVSRSNSHNVQNEAANFPHQSTASDITLDTANRVWEYILHKWDARIVNLVHDSLIIEVQDDAEIIHAVAQYVKGVMEQVPIDWGITRVPFLAEPEVGDRWGMMIDESESYMHAEAA